MGVWPRIPAFTFGGSFACFCSLGRTAGTRRCSRLILLKVRPSSLISDLAHREPSYWLQSPPLSALSTRCPLHRQEMLGTYWGIAFPLQPWHLSAGASPLSAQVPIAKRQGSEPRPARQPERDMVLCQSPALFLGLHYVKDGRRACQSGALTSQETPCLINLTLQIVLPWGDRVRHLDLDLFENC